jgi:hypothetical protein
MTGSDPFCANVTFGQSSRPNVTFARNPRSTAPRVNGEFGHSNRTNVTFARNERRR